MWSVVHGDGVITTFSCLFLKYYMKDNYYLVYTPNKSRPVRMNEIEYRSYMIKKCGGQNLHLLEENKNLKKSS